MAKVLNGPRIAKGAPIRLGCAAIVLDEAGRVLLTRRADNGQWCLPGGAMDSGESLAEACQREVLEETGLRVRVTKLVGVYSSPDRVLGYADGNRYHLVALSFAAERLGGELALSDETLDVGFFDRAALDSLDLMHHHRERLDDFFAGRPEAFVR